MSSDPTAPLTAPGQPFDRAISRLQIAILLGSLSFGILEFALPIYARRLGASALDIGGVISIFAVMITILRPLVGWGIDHWGRKSFLAVSLLFYGLSMLFFGFAGSLGMLYAARLVQGIGSSLFWIPAYTVVTELNTRDWGRSVGSVNMFSSRGGFVGTFLGFFMILVDSTALSAPVVRSSLRSATLGRCPEENPSLPGKPQTSLLAALSGFQCEDLNPTSYLYRADSDRDAFPAPRRRECRRLAVAGSPVDHPPDLP